MEDKEIKKPETKKTEKKEVKKVEEVKKVDHKYKLLNISTRDYSNVESYLNEGWKLSGSPFIYMGTIWQAIYEWWKQ